MSRKKDPPRLVGRGGSELSCLRAACEEGLAEGAADVDPVGVRPVLGAYAQSNGLEAEHDLVVRSSDESGAVLNREDIGLAGRASAEELHGHGQPTVELPVKHVEQLYSRAAVDVCYDVNCYRFDVGVLHVPKELEHRRLAGHDDAVVGTADAIGVHVAAFDDKVESVGTTDRVDVPRGNEFAGDNDEIADQRRAAETGAGYDVTSRLKRIRVEADLVGARVLIVVSQATPEGQVRETRQIVRIKDSALGKGAGAKRRTDAFRRQWNSM